MLCFSVLRSSHYTSGHLCRFLRSERLYLEFSQFLTRLSTLPRRTSSAYHWANLPYHSRVFSPPSLSVSFFQKSFYGTANTNQVAEADSYWTIEPDGAVRMRMDVEPPGVNTPVESVITWFTNTAQRFPNQPAMKVKRAGKWQTWTYSDYLRDIQIAAKAFIRLGLEPSHSVGILGFNSPEWFISDIAAIFAGGLAVGVYTTNTAEACHFCAEDSRMNIYIVEDNAQLQKILQFRDRLPELKAIVQYIGEPQGNHPNVYSWAQLLQMGRDTTDDDLRERQKLIAPNKCCNVIYTSGTTGQPKGAMLSHDNLIWTSKMVVKNCGLNSQDVYISYLPLSHVAAQMTDLYLPITSGGLVYFAPPEALKGQGLIETWKEARPTALIGVPRVWEKIQEKMEEAIDQNTGLRQKLGEWAMNLGLRGNLAKIQGGSLPPLFWLADRLVFSKVRTKLGLERARFTASGAAPIMRDTQEFFLSLNIPICDVYGLSESSAPHTSNLPNMFRIGSAGRMIPGVTSKIVVLDDKGNGEICMYGRHIFMGYMGLEDKTRTTFDKDNYFLSGDIGKFDQDGFLFITGRVKELLKTAGGEKIAPVALENNIKAEIPIASQAMVIGDKRKFLSVFLTLKTEMDIKSGKPLDILTPPVQAWIKEKCKVDIKTLTQARELAVLTTEIQKCLDKANLKARSQAQIVRKFKILPVDFSVPGGELGPTLKLKRPTVTEIYADDIEEFYNSGCPST